MDYPGKRQQLAPLVALVLFLSLETSNAGLVHITNYKCSYFFDDGKSWEDSNIACKRENGTLIVMETLDEWDFINSVIQRIPTPTEWYIGLKSTTWTSSRNSFTWINGKSLTFDKWIPGQPDANGLYVKIVKEYHGQGTFDDIDGKSLMPYICEYKVLDSKQCSEPSESTPPFKAISTTAATTTNPITNKATVPSTTPTKDYFDMQFLLLFDFQLATDDLERHEDIVVRNVLEHLQSLFPSVLEAQYVTYVDLTFNNSMESSVHNPAPYQPVEYAVIIGKKQAK